MEPSHNPERTTLDRVQRACLRSGTTDDEGIHVIYGLHRDGICLKGTHAHKPDLEYNRLVSWKEIALRRDDPLMVSHKLILEELRKCR